MALKMLWMLSPFSGGRISKENKVLFASLMYWVILVMKV
jgi:hypothetical protein